MVTINWTLDVFFERVTLAIPVTDEATVHTVADAIEALTALVGQPPLKWQLRREEQTHERT